jgi:outer membrane protein OmpA-like peptidoglycan-associated protein
MKIGLLFVSACLLMAQVPNPTQRQATATPDTGQPIFRVTVVSKTAKAINYRHRSGATKVDFRGTALMPDAEGEAKVESKKGYIEVEVEFDDMVPASRFGAEYLTYVMWAITPEGRAQNLGEILLDGSGRGKLNVTTELQAFGLIVTAEPYFAVTQPSDVVVMENIVRADTMGKVEVIDAKYELLQRGSYQFDPNARPIQIDRNVPLELYEARNAVQIARAAGAAEYAGETFTKATGLLSQAENYQARKQKRPTAMTAREAVQTAEDARIITLKRKEEERLAKERQAAAEREAAAKQKAAEEQARAAEAARQKAEADLRAREEAVRRAQAEQDRAAADRARQEAEAAAQRAAQERAAADAARQAAEAAKAQADAARAALAAEAERAKQAAAEADRLRLQAEQDRENLRKQLLQQFNMILETRESARGLIVNMSDVLFDFNKYTLKPGAKEKLAKISGIILGHPGLNLEVEGHTDAIGSDEYNQKLSEQRAGAVRDYLTAQGVQNVVARGFGEAQPVASNDNAAGRQMNRRVELVVSGEIIGTKLGSAPSNTVGDPAGTQLRPPNQ